MTRAHRRKKEALLAEASVEEHLLAEAQGEATALPEGLYEMLELKAVLQRELRTAVEKPIVVSVELLGDEWVFLVRGYKPPFSKWNGHKVLFMRSIDYQIPTK